jgi:hypothetical protein
LAIEVLTNAVPALQAIGIVAAIEQLIVAPARDQRVIATIAKKDLINAGPALQAIVIGDVIAGIDTAMKGLQVAPARDQRVIPRIAPEALTSAAPAPQAIGINAAM